VHGDLPYPHAASWGAGVSACSYRSVVREALLLWTLLHAALARIIHPRTLMEPDGSLAGAPLPECFLPTGVQVPLAMKRG